MKIKNNNISSFDDFDKISDDDDRRGLFRNKKSGKKIMFILGLGVILIIITLVVLLVYLGKHKSSNAIIYPTIVISIDSFRAEYLERGLTPNLQKLIDDNSFRAQYTVAQFPSKTFPNHYSIATGLYPENHGIVSNHMYDPTIDKVFHMGSNESLNSYWWWGEPIWVTAKKSNIKTACYFWPGCNVRNLNPDFYFENYNWEVKTLEIFNQTIQWRTNKDKNLIPKLTLAYVHEVDTVSHRYGPNSKQVNDSIIEMDTNIGKFIEQLKEFGVYEKTNIIFLSDHGMIEIPTSKYIYLDELTLDKSISSKFYTPDALSNGVSYPSPIISIFQNDSKYSIDYLYNELNKNYSKFVDFYKKENIPYRFNFNSTSNSRIPPLIGIAKPGYSIIVSRESFASNKPDLGSHGYDPENDEMHSIFIAHGPNIKSSGNQDNSTTTTLKQFKNTEIYNLLAQLIGIEEKHYAPTNGTSLLNNNIYKSSK